MDMTRGDAEYLAYKAHIECLGRKPTKADLKLRTDEILADPARGLVVVYATLYESKEGRERQAEDARIRKALLALADEKGIK